jgi:hypothetical protein
MQLVTAHQRRNDDAGDRGLELLVEDAQQELCRALAGVGEIDMRDRCGRS